MAGSGWFAGRSVGADSCEPQETQNLNQNRQMKKFLSFLTATLVTTVVIAGEFADISISEVKALSESKKAVIIDVNGSESYAKGHVPGALDFAAVKAK